MSEKPPAGWYPDSTGTTRWWDGEQWTEHTPPPPPTQQAPTASTPEPVFPSAAEAEPHARTRADAKAEKAYEKASRPWYKKKRFILPLGFIALMIAVAAGSGGDGDRRHTERVDHHWQHAGRDAR